MSRWYEGIREESSNIIYSRIRLARNWDEYVFPSRLSEQAASQVTEQLREGLKEAKTGEHPLLWNDLAAMNGAQKQALRERRILNRTAVEKNGSGGLYLSEDESCSLLLGADDHICIQFLAPGLDLEDLWKKADQMDDFINERFSYAFDEKYGYLTTFPTNVGTGLKACVVLHLPMLSQVRKFQSIVGDMGRLGTAIRGLYGEGSENYGNMYELSNQRSLGQSEREIIEQVAKAAAQLNNQELRVRNAALNARRLEREDETWKSYGILKYARRITEKDARIFLSQLMAGEEDGVISFEKERSLYSLMIGIKPANLALWASRPLDKEEADCVRAAYIRERLPRMIESA